MRPAMRWVLFTCALALSPACGDDDNAIDIGQDALLDTRRDAPEVSRDVGRDAPADTTPDTPEDVQVDGGPDDPEWVFLPGLPERCRVQRAVHPERLWRGEWLSCGDGCTYLGDDPEKVRTVRPHTGYHDGSRGVFVVNQTPRMPGLDREEATRVSLIATTDSRVLAAWRQPPGVPEGVYCSALPWVEGGQAALVVAEFDETRDVTSTRLYLGSVDTIGAQELPTIVLDETIVPIGSLIQRASLSAEVFAGELQPAGDLLLVRPDGSMERQRFTGTVQHERVIGEDVFFELWEDGKTRILHTRFGEEPNVLLDDPDVHFVGLTVTAGTLTWLRAPSDGRLSRAERMDLYTSPYATRAEDITPRFVASYLPDHATGYEPNVVGGEGFFAAFRAPFFRLSDGAALQYPRVDGRLAGNIGFLWMAGGEVAISTVLTLDDGGTGTIARVSLDSLRSLE